MTSSPAPCSYIGPALFALAALFLGIAIGMGIEAGFDAPTEPLQFGGSIRVHLQSTEAGR